MQKVVKLFFLFLLSAGIMIPVLAQDRLLKGVVTDAKFHTPVPYAALFVEGTSVGTVTDNAGEFSLLIPDSLSGRRLVVARERYQVTYLSWEAFPAGETCVIRILSDDYQERVKALQDSLIRRGGGVATLLVRAVKLVKDDWVPLGDVGTNRFDLGRIQTFPTYNPIEGIRLRVGVASNARLSPRFFVRGYLAYGFKDQRLKYRGEAIYSFRPKAYHEDEFPKNNLRLAYEHDLYSPGDMHPYALNDLLLVTYRRSRNEATYRNFAEINYEREYKNGLAHTLRMRRSRLTPQGTLQFHRLRDDGNTALPEKSLQTTELGLLLRYSLREAYDQQKRKRIPLEMTSPQFFFSHTLGMNDFRGGESVYHRSEFSIQKRFLLGSAGRLDLVAEAMKVWNKVPFPLLVYPNQRYRYQIENNFFFLNRALEFMADEQYTLRMTFVGDDLLLAKIPFVNLIKAKELISLRASHGRLSDKNNPAFSPDGLYCLPTDLLSYDKIPYMEGSIGLANVLGLLRMEYVHRFTYRNHPNAILGAFRIDITL